MAASLTGISRCLRNAVGYCTTKTNLALPSLLMNRDVGLNQTQVRTRYVNWHMLKDVKRRKVFEEHHPERMRINALRKNRILPLELREMADKEIRELPLDSSIVRLHRRCTLTSRPRGNTKRWRLSRIMFRHLSDYNYLSGVTRGIW